MTTGTPAKYLVHPTANGYAVVMHVDGDQTTVDTAKSYEAAKKKAATWTAREAKAAKKAGTR